MRTFTLIAAAAAVAFGLSTTPAMADSFSFSFSTTSHKSPKHYGGSGYNQGYSRGYKYGNKYGYNRSYSHKKRYYGREGDRRSYRRDNRLGLPNYGFGLQNYRYQRYGYNNYGYHAPKLSKKKVIRRLKRQHSLRVKRIRFSHGFYNVFARDHYGRKVKLKVNPYTGRIVSWRYRG